MCTIAKQNFYWDESYSLQLYEILQDSKLDFIVFETVTHWMSKKFVYPLLRRLTKYISQQE